MGDSLWFSCGATGVKDEEEVFGVHRLTGAVGGLSGHGFGPFEVTTLLIGDGSGGLARALQNKDGFDGWAAHVESFVGDLLELNNVSASPAAVGGDDDFAACVICSLSNGVR